MSDRRLGQNPVAEVEDMRPARSACPMCRIAASSAGPPAMSTSGSRLPCSGMVGSRVSAAQARSRAVSSPSAVAPVLAAKSTRRGPAPRGNAITLARGMTGAEAGDDRPDRRNAPTLERIGRQDARPGVEDLDTIDAGVDLAGQIEDRGLDEPVDEILERLRRTVGEEPGRRLIGRSLAGDHVARDGERRAAEADQRRAGRQLGLDPVDRLEDRPQVFEVERRLSIERCRRRRRSAPGAARRSVGNRPSGRGHRARRGYR